MCDHKDWLKFLYYKYGQRQIPEFDMEVDCNEIVYRDCSGAIDDKLIMYETIDKTYDESEFKKKWLLSQDFH